MPSSHRFDRGNNLRIVVQWYTYPRLVHSAFQQIWENGESHSVIVAALRKSIDIVLERARYPELVWAVTKQQSLLTLEQPEISVTT